MINASGGVHGRKIVTRVLDDDNKADNAQANARKLIADGAFILFGSIEGGPSTAVMWLLQQKVPFLARWLARQPCVGPFNTLSFRSVPNIATNFVR
jgi:ABC-type branched-subunit amino acid transport system substrate-binding protein